MQLTKSNSHYNNVSNNLHRWPISNTTGINTETRELILKYYKLPGQWSAIETAY